MTVIVSEDKVSGSFPAAAQADWRRMKLGGRISVMSFCFLCEIFVVTSMTS